MVRVVVVAVAFFCACKPAAPAAPPQPKPAVIADPRWTIPPHGTFTISLVADALSGGPMTARLELVGTQKERQFEGTAMIRRTYVATVTDEAGATHTYLGAGGAMIGSAVSDHVEWASIDLYARDGLVLDSAGHHWVVQGFHFEVTENAPSGGTFEATDATDAAQPKTQLIGKVIVR